MQATNQNISRTVQSQAKGVRKAPKRLTLDQRRRMARQRLTELFLENQAKKNKEL